MFRWFLRFLDLQEACFVPVYLSDDGFFFFSSPEGTIFTTLRSRVLTVQIIDVDRSLSMLGSLPEQNSVAGCLLTFLETVHLYFQRDSDGAAVSRDSSLPFSRLSSFYFRSR